MKYTRSIARTFPAARRKLYLAVAAQMLLAAGAQAAPTGGVVVAGEGRIDQSGLETTITQASDRLAIDWTDFNISANERVQFLQPGETSVALNRILGSEASQIFGRLDANGHVILMNPNGVFFGESATVNVGGLVASGLAINPDDFMNGDFALSAVDGLDGAVINQGIINASTGGNVALVGRRVDNQGLISARLGSVTLAAGKEAVLTFDQQGLLGVRVSQEILQNELGVEASVQNSGEINAEGGRILLTGSVSQDIFSSAVNSQGLNAKASVVMHEDGSFTLGAGADVVNTGTLNASSNSGDAGTIVVLGENIQHSGAILADSRAAGKSGNIELHAQDTTLLHQQNTLSATAAQGKGGAIKVLGDRVGVVDSSQILASGSDGGGDIHIGGGFQGNDPNLRNASRTVVGKNTLINADAVQNGDGGDVVVWANDTASFTGNVSVRGGETGGDGGSVEVSGKENLRFDGKVDRTAVEGKNGTLLLDPENITIVSAARVTAGESDGELDDREILLTDGDGENFKISDAAIAQALEDGDVILQARETIETDWEDFGATFSIVVSDETNTNSLILESGNDIILNNIEIDLGAGDLLLVSGILDWCEICNEDSRAQISAARFSTSGNLYIATPDYAGFTWDNYYNPLNRQEKNPASINIFGARAGLSIISTDALTVLGDVHISTNLQDAQTPILLPSGRAYEIPALSQSSYQEAVAEITGIGSEINIHGNLVLSASSAEISPDKQTAKLVGVDINSLTENRIDIESSGAIELNDSLISNQSELPSEVSFNAGGELRFIHLDDGENYNTGIFNTNGGNITVNAKTIEGVQYAVISTDARETGRNGNIEIVAENDIYLPNIVSSGDVHVTSKQGSIFSEYELDIQGETHLTAEMDIRLETERPNSHSFLDAQSDIYLNAGRDIYFSAITSHALYELGTIAFMLPSDNQVSLVLEAGGAVYQKYDIFTGGGDYTATASEFIFNDGVQINTDFSNATANSLTGTGNIFLTETITDFPASSRMVLPNIRTQGDCAELVECGALHITTNRNVSDKPFDSTGSEKHIKVFGDTSVVSGALDLSGELSDIQFDGLVSLDTGHVSLFTKGGFHLSDWRVVGTAHIAVDEVEGRSSDLISNAVLDIGSPAVISTPGELILQGTGTRFRSRVSLQGSRVELNHDGDLALEGLFLTGGPDGASSIINVNGSVVTSDTSAFFIEQATGRQLSLDIIGGLVDGVYQQASPVVFDVTGDLILSAADSRISSIQVLNAQNVQLTNNTDMTIAGINAQNLRLDTSGNVIQSAAINVSGESIFNLSGSAGLSLEDETNDFNEVTLNSTATNSTRIKDRNDLVLANINANSHVQVLSAGEGALVSQKAGSKISLTSLGILSIAADNIHVGEAGSSIQTDGGALTFTAKQSVSFSGVLESVSETAIRLSVSFDSESGAELNINPGASFIGFNSDTSLISLGGGDDVINIAADTPFYIESGAGADTFNLLAEGLTILNLNGEEGVDTLVSANGDNDWEIGAVNEGQLFSAGITTGFFGIENLVGGAGDDSFSFTNLQFVGMSFNGGGGTNSISITSNEELEWQLNADGGELSLSDALGSASFANIQRLTAFGPSTFFVNDLNTTVTEIAGSALSGYTFDFSGITGELELNLNAFPFALTGIEYFHVVGNGAESRLIGPDADSLLVIDDNGISIWQNASYESDARFTPAFATFENFVRLEGGAGKNDFVVESVNLEMTLVGSDSDRLIGNSHTGTIDNTWTINGTYSGLLNDNIVFENICNLQGNAGNDTFIFSADSVITDIKSGFGDDTFILANNISAGLLDGGEGQDTLDRNGLNAVYTYLNQSASGETSYKTTSIEIETNAGGSTTVVAVDGYDAEWTIDGDGSVSVTATDANGVSVNNRFTSVTRLEGGSGADEFILATGGAVAEGIFGSGDDTLRASDTSNRWTINGADAGQLAIEENNTTLLFEGIANLIGGTGTDLFNIATGGSISGSIDGGTGTDTLQISDATAVNNWQLGLQNSLALVNQFRRVENLVGNANDDLFTFAAVSDVRKIEGRGGNNTLDWRADEVVVNLCGCVESNDVGFSGINNFVADAAFNNTLIGLDEENTWTLTGMDSGTVNSVNFSGFKILQGGTAADTLVGLDEALTWRIGGQGLNTLSNLDQQVSFSGMESLLGGADQDAFYLDTSAGPVTLSIAGGSGVNTLYANSDNSLGSEWTIDGINSGTVTGLNAFSNIQTLIGGAGADTFILASGSSIAEIYGGAGDDSFVIGRDVTAENIYGEAGDDSFDVDLGLILSGALDGGSGGEVAGDYLNLNKYTVLTASSDLEALLGFAFRNFERIDQPNNQGVYTGGDATNFWYITGRNRGRLEIRDGANAGIYEFSDVHSLRGGSGEDVFIFANDAAAITTIIDGGTGDGINTLDLSAQGLINQWLIDGSNSGRVINDSNSSGNVFTNIAYLIGGSNRDIFSLQSGGAIAGGVDGGLGSDQLGMATTQAHTWQLGGAAGHSVTGIASFSNIEGLMGSAGDDTFNVLSENLDVERIDGASGFDTLNFQHANRVVVNLRDGTAGGLQISAIERFLSSNVGSVLIADDTSNTWILDGTNAGSIRYLIDTGADPINVAFDGFGNLQGGAADDRFTLQVGAALSGLLDGGAGSDSVDLQARANDVHVSLDPELANGLVELRLGGVEQLLGNGRTWLYGAGDQSYTWTITGQRSGQVTSTLVDADNQLLAFENLSAIVGGAHDDIFQVVTAAPLLSLDGGAAVSADLVDYSQVNGDLRINLASALSGQNGVLTGVEGIRGNNGGPDSLHTAELVAADTDNLWVIGSNGSDLADGINDGQVTSGGQTIQFLDFNLLTGGARVDSFVLDGGVLLGTLSGGAGNDVFDVALAGVNNGTLIDGGEGVDSLTLTGGDAAGIMTYTASAFNGEFDYSLAEAHFTLSHQGVEMIRDNSRAQTLEIRGSTQADTIGLRNGSFQINDGAVIEHSNKTRIGVRSGINDIIEINDHLVVGESLTLANGTVIANDPANSSITAPQLVLEATRDVGLASARLRTSVDDLIVRDSVGDIYLQEQNGLNLAEFNANGVFDLLLLNGDLTSSAPLASADVFRVNANNGDITLRGDNQLRDDVALTGARVELHNASTLTLVGVTAGDLILRTQRGIEGDGPLVVSGLTEIDAQGDVRLDFASNDFNRVRVTNAWNLTLVDQNTLELLDINASGTVVVRSANNIELNDHVSGGTGVNVTSGSGSINQNGSITTGSGSVAVTAGNGAVNLGEDARIVSNGGSVNISAGNGNVNMGTDTRIAANGGNVNIEAADSVVVGEVISSGDVAINAGSGSVSDGNGGATNVIAGALQSSSNTGFGSNDSLETQVGSIDVATNTGDVGISNVGEVTVEGIRTGGGNIAVTNQGDLDLAGSINASNGGVGGDVNLDVNLGSIKQTGPSSVPAIVGGTVEINVPEGAVAEGGLWVNADVVRIIALSKAGEIFVNPGADKIEYFSGSFKFEDQLLSVEPLDDIDPAIFTNVRSYFYNDISLLLPSDQRYDEDEEEEGVEEANE